MKQTSKLQHHTHSTDVTLMRSIQLLSGISGVGEEEKGKKNTKTKRKSGARVKNYLLNESTPNHTGVTNENIFV